MIIAVHFGINDIQKESLMFWHGNLDQILDVARIGHHIVMTPTSHCYFDYTYERIPTEKVYSFDPIPVKLEENYVSSIMGVQANFWSHIDRTEPTMSRQIFPGLIALSEVGWTKKEKKTGRIFPAASLCITNFWKY